VFVAYDVVHKAVTFVIYMNMFATVEIIFSQRHFRQTTQF
jgi:hypothetical protein